MSVKTLFVKRENTFLRVKMLFLSVKILFLSVGLLFLSVDLLFLHILETHFFLYVILSFTINGLNNQLIFRQLEII